MATATYKCPNCGGGLQFVPDIQKLKCEYCLSEFTDAQLAEISAAMEKKAEQEAAAAQATAAAAAAADADETSHLRGYTCDSCGAEVVTEETTSATFCYYCHNPVLLTERLTGDFKPTRIIPFAYDKEKAVSSFLTWDRKKKFVPREFYSNSQLEKITGMYVPYWMADIEADVDFAGKGINRRVWQVGDIQYTETKEYGISRQGKIDVNNVHEVAMRKIDKGLIDSISPYDEAQAVDFSMSYLSGFFAEKYDIAKDEIQPQIENQARDYTKLMLQDTFSGYSQVQMEREDMNIAVKGWNYALLPAWILTYLYKGKTYVYAINGQNGKSYGELPVNKQKLSLVSGVIAAVVFALAIVGGLLIW